jgi:NTP pyrophosphatase (non-canonical NTP hydrolase)
MSNILEHLAAAEEFVAARQLKLAQALALEEDAVMMNLSMAQQRVAMLRLEIGDKWPDPDVMDSYVFLVSEIGEVGDALLRANFGHRGDYSRNHAKQVDVAAELGDVFLMLCTLATTLGVDLDSALQGCIDKLKEKHE